MNRLGCMPSQNQPDNRLDSGDRFSGSGLQELDGRLIQRTRRNTFGGM